MLSDYNKNDLRKVTFKNSDENDIPNIIHNII